MSHPYEVALSYSWPCPYCGEEDQEVDDCADTGYFLSGACEKCEKEFNVDAVNAIYYDAKGDKIEKEVCHGTKS